MNEKYTLKILDEKKIEINHENLHENYEAEKREN